MSVREILSKFSDEHQRKNLKVDDLVKWGIRRNNKRIIAEAALEGLRKSGYTVILTDKSPVQNSKTAILNEIVKKDFNATLIVFKGPVSANTKFGHIILEDDDNHDIFRSYALHLAGALDRAFGLINTANDYGDIQEVFDDSLFPEDW